MFFLFLKSVSNEQSSNTRDFLLVPSYAMGPAGRGGKKLLMISFSRDESFLVNNSVFYKFPYKLIIGIK